MSELRFNRVRVQYGDRRRPLVAVDGVDLVVPSGKVLGLVGESGSGKSTLARAAVGLTPLTQGNISLDGVPLDLRRRRGRRPPVQMIFQDPYSSLDPRMTVASSLLEAMPKGENRSSAARRDAVAHILEQVELDPSMASFYPSGLSGGQRQRVALARALSTRPAVIIADEITSALDVSIQGTVLNLVRDLQRRTNMSMLFISHNLAVVRYVSDLIAVMYLGKIVECGSVKQILDDPQHPYTRELLAAAAGSVPATLDAPAPSNSGAAAIVADSEPADPLDPPSGCRFHPRCPVGPLVVSQRQMCATTDPSIAAASRLHDAACHFPGQPQFVGLNEIGPSPSAPTPPGGHP